MVTATLLVVTGCGGSEVAADVEYVAPAKAEVLYEVDGTALRASVTYETGTGTEQGKIRLPMTSATGSTGLAGSFERGSFLYISAQNQGDINMEIYGYGSVTCRITVDGVVISENTSNGQFGIATCKGTA